MGRDRITNNSLENSKGNTPTVAEGLVLVDATAAFIVADRKEKGQVNDLRIVSHLPFFSLRCLCDFSVSAVSFLQERLTADSQRTPS
jgi:hypothetical protein